MLLNMTRSAKTCTFLEVELEETNKDARDGGEENYVEEKDVDDVDVRVNAKKCTELARLQGQIS